MTVTKAYKLMVLTAIQTLISLKSVYEFAS